MASRVSKTPHHAEASADRGEQPTEIYFNEGTREVYLNREIEEEMAAKMCALLRHIDSLGAAWGSYPPITMYINSPGGAIRDAFAIIDCMDSLESRVITCVEGTACSAAALVSMAGYSGYRIITPNSTAMIHQLSAGVSGTFRQLTDHQSSLDTEMDIMVEHIMRCTGQRKDKVKRDLKGDLYLRAQGALDYGKKGIADHILPEG